LNRFSDQSAYVKEETNKHVRWLPSEELRNGNDDNAGSYCIQLIDNHSYLSYANTLGQYCMFFRLTIRIEPRFELTSPRVDDKQCNVGL
jgi:hypothetical protein